MLIDLIAAKAEEAQAILSTSGHATVWATLEARTVDHVKLASLAFILKGKPPEDEPVIAYMKSFENLVSASDDGPWINLLPADLVEDLARLSEDKVAVVARAWAATEEAKLDGWNEEDVSLFLREFSVFAASAIAQEKNILLWVCL
jgi:hypothetical protein